MDTIPRAGKRGRSDSLSSISSTASTLSLHSLHSARSLSPLNKIQRGISKPPSETLECNLPPTCFPSTQSFGTVQELERHQLAFHTFVCRSMVRDKTPVEGEAGPSNLWNVPREFTSRKRDQWKECRKIFPDQRILNLHQAETHDPIIRQKQKEGISTFKCFIPPPECTRVFINPKHRRLHLIDKHKYPREYYFAITNHGLNRITEKDGLGASLIRPRTYFPETQAEVEPTSSTAEETVDVDMDDLTKGMKALESSLTLVPAQLRRKAKGNNKAGPARVLEAGISGN